MKGIAFFGAMVILAIAAFLAGRAQLRTGNSLLDAGRLGPNSDASKAFHRDSQEISKRYQAGEIDEAAWRRETAEATTRLEAASSAAGAAWQRQIAAGQRANQVGLSLLAAGVLAIGIGVVGALVIRRVT